MNDKECSHPIVYVDMRSYASDLKKGLVKFFKYPLTHCRNCGALIPELKIQHQNRDGEPRTYSFCCYSVNEYEIDEKASTPEFPVRSDTKVVMETDYKKFRDYLNTKIKDNEK